MGAGAVRGNSRRGPHVRPDPTGRSGRDPTGTGCADAGAPRDPVDLHELSGEEFVHQRVYSRVLLFEDTGRGRPSDVAWRGAGARGRADARDLRRPASAGVLDGRGRRRAGPADGGAHRLAAAILPGHRPGPPAVDELRRVEQPRHERERDAVHEEQLLADPPGLVVVQQRLPPVADDVDGRVDRDDLAAVLRATGLQVLDEREADVAVRRGDDAQRHLDLHLDPLPLEELRLASSSTETCTASMLSWFAAMA